MRSAFNTILTVALLVAWLSCAPCTCGAPAYYLDKLDTPDYTQTDPAYGGIPDGGAACGPTAASNAVMWLANNNYMNLAPLTADRKHDQWEVLALNLRTEEYISGSGGAGPISMCNGLSDYIHDCGYDYTRLEVQTWRNAGGWETDPPVAKPDLDWARDGIVGPGLVQMWNVGWYTYDAVSKDYTREGGHWVTMAGYGHDGTDYDPDWFIFNDPAPRNGYTWRNEYVLPQLITAWRSNMRGYYLISGPDWNINSSGDCAILDAVIVLEMEPVDNEAPVAAEDYYSVDEDLSLSVPADGLFANDVDPDNDTLTPHLMSDTSYGSLVVHADGSFDYTPLAGHHGTDQFTYRAVDGHAFSDVTTVTITVNSINDVPVALDDAYEVDQDTVLNVFGHEGVLANDSDPDNEDDDLYNDVVLEAVWASDPLNGSLELNSNGSFTYTPDPDWYGTDSFTYRADDGEALSDLAAVVIEVLAALEIPGDATGDGCVNAEDAERLAANWGQGDATWEMGDFDDDGIVGPKDAIILASHWGYGTSEASAAVPEPSTLAGLLLLSIVGAVGLGARSGRRR